MRHDVKYSQTHSAAVRQRPGHSGVGGGGGNDGRSDSSGYDYNRGYGPQFRQGSNGNEHGTVYGRVGGVEHGGGTVSALSGGDHESQKQWDWLDEVLEKSSRNKETVSCRLCNP